MRATRRYRAAAALAATLAALALAFDRWLLLVGAAGLAGYLLAAQHAFLRATRRTAGALSVEQSVGRPRAVAGSPVSVTLAASLPRPAPLRLAVEAGLPVAATGPQDRDRRIRIRRGGRSARATFPVGVPVAGAHAFRPPAVAASDPLGLLLERFERGPAPTLTVEPRGPREIHVGEGGERVATAFGEHPAGLLAPGLAPTEVREYQPGDAANQIDWRATARHDRPYVREAEAETDRRTLLLVDHRSPMGDGPPGETKLDYVRAVALSVANAARADDDPLGLYAVGDGGLTVSMPVAATAGRYAAIRRALHGLEPTAAAGDAGPRHGPADARLRRERLETDATAFGRTLRPFLGEATAYVHRVESEPLFGAARHALGRLRGSRLTVLFTDDTDPAQVRETVKVARRGDAHVLAFLAPGVLFDPGGLGDLEAAYAGYRDFESFRRELAGMERVSALEVAPGDRVEAVLEAGRRRRESGRAR